MNENIEKLKEIVNKYHQYIEAEDFDAINELVEGGDIVSACYELAEKIDGMKVFVSKGVDTPGYDLTSYVFAWIDNGEIEGIVLDVESF